VQVVATSDGIPVEFCLHAGTESEQTGRRGLALDLPEGSVLYTDAGYTDYVAEDLFNEASGSQHQTARHQNSKRPHHPAQQFLIQYFRKGIETCFSQLTARFPKQIHAVMAKGVALKIAYSPQLGLAKLKRTAFAQELVQPGFNVISLKLIPCTHTCRERAA
jgi:hypothetical protein